MTKRYSDIEIWHWSWP